MKTTIKFEFDGNDDYEVDEIKRITTATEAYMALHDISEDIFRPARKHGYPNSKLQALIESAGETEEGYGVGEEIISELEQMFVEILRDRGVDLENLK